MGFLEAASVFLLSFALTVVIGNIISLLMIINLLEISLRRKRRNIEIEDLYRPTKTAVGKLFPLPYMTTDKHVLENLSFFYCTVDSLLFLKRNEISY